MSLPSERDALADQVLVGTPIGAGREICTVFTGASDARAPAVTKYVTLLFERGMVADQLGWYASEREALLGHGNWVAKVGQRFFCPGCWKTSPNIEALKYGWCGACDWQTGPTWEQRRL
jgi:hypothetical protein